MPAEPAVKRACAFFDGQNLFYAAKDAFGYQYPNYDPMALAQFVCQQKGWNLERVYFYTGIPSQADKPFWHQFWANRLAAMGTRGIRTFSRPLKYRNQTVTLPDGTSRSLLVGQEKGVDIRIALDVVRKAREQAFDVGIVFSQDQDLSEMADEVRKISVQQNLWIKLACAFPVSPTYLNRRGINGTEWVQIQRATYDACIDPTDYRP